MRNSPTRHPEEVAAATDEGSLHLLDSELPRFFAEFTVSLFAQSDSKRSESAQ